MPKSRTSGPTRASAGRGGDPDSEEDDDDDDDDDGDDDDDDEDDADDDALVRGKLCVVVAATHSLP